MGLLVGFPRSFGTLLVLRFLAGFWNGWVLGGGLVIDSSGDWDLFRSQAAVAKTYLSELADESNQASAFAIQSLGWQIGWSLAGLAGGWLSHVERTFPSLYDNEFILKYPYALGPLVASIAPLVSIVVGLFIMRETLPVGGFTARLDLDDDMWNALKIWVTMVSCNICYMCTMPLFLFAPVVSGGMGLSSRAIGARKIAYPTITSL